MATVAPCACAPSPRASASMLTVIVRLAHCTPSSVVAATGSGSGGGAASVGIFRIKRDTGAVRGRTTIAVVGQKGHPGVTSLDQSQKLPQFALQTQFGIDHYCTRGVPYISRPNNVSFRVCYTKLYGLEINCQKVFIH